MLHNHILDSDYARYTQRGKEMMRAQRCARAWTRVSADEQERDAPGIRAPEPRGRGDRQKDSPEREARHRGDESGE